MRIAVLIISLCLVMIIGVQSCAVGVGAELMADEDTAAGGAAGIMVAFLFVLGAAFALGKPTVSAIMFGIAAVTGFSVGASTEFTDMSIWGGVALVLGIMSLLGRRELRKKAAT